MLKSKQIMEMMTYRITDKISLSQMQLGLVVILPFALSVLTNVYGH